MGRNFKDQPPLANSREAVLGPHSRAAYLVAALYAVACSDTSAGGDVSVATDDALVTDASLEALDGVTADFAAPADSSANVSPDASDGKGDAKVVGADGDATTVFPTKCPLAAFTIAEGNAVTPSTELHLNGTGSLGIGGAAITFYQWTVVQPKGSVQHFKAAATLPSPTFLPSVVGTYEICLTVKDETGVKACAPTCQEVVAVPDTALHVQLLWDTPIDSNQGDEGPDTGADMDLHVASDLAQQPDLDCDGSPDPWFDPTYDCFWFQPQAFWGPMTTSDGDAILSLDDTDGAGPENFDSASPLGYADKPRQYAVGVHYWHGHGFGTSFAEVTLFVYGAPVLLVQSPHMDPLDMWFVGKLNWPNAAAGGKLPPVDRCFQTPGTTGKACKAGVPSTMWQPTGDACIRPCYVSPSQPVGAQDKGKNCP